MKVLVTGHKGFVGGYLVDYLNDHQVYGMDIKESLDQDFTKYENVRKAIDSIRPDWIFHIGALAYVPESFIDPYLAFQTNTIGSLNILEAVRRIGLKTKIHLCGTSEEYGDSSAVPLTELSLPQPLSPYAIAKLAMSHLGLLYGESYNMEVVVTRTFNHTGPGRGEQYAESAFAKQIAEIERGERQTLYHGDLSPIRNYTDVRDVVRAYVRAITLPSGIYNVCSEQNLSIETVLKTLVGLSQVSIPTEQDRNLLRPADFSFNKPSYEKFHSLTGWAPEIDISTTLKDMLDFWR